VKKLKTSPPPEPLKRAEPTWSYHYVPERRLEKRLNRLVRKLNTPLKRRRTYREGPAHARQ
jgi:hypothetical protein